MPLNRMESDVLGNDRASKIVRHLRIPIPVGWENLERRKQLTPGLQADELTV